MALLAPGNLFTYKDYRNLWISNLLVTIGASAFPIALAVTVLDAGGTTTTLGLILASRVLSSVILAPVGGVWADRLPRKVVMIGADIYRALLMIGLIFVATPSVPAWGLAILVFAMGAGEAFGFPASGAILPSVLPPEKLPAGNVLRSIGVRIAQVVGPGVGGFSVAIIGGRMTFAITAAFFIAGTFLLMKIVEKPRDVVEIKPSFVTDLHEGLKTVWHTPWVAACIAMSTLQLMVVLASENVLLPVITRREFHTNTVFATAAAMFSIGGSISALIAMRVRAKHPGLVAVVIWGFFAVAPLVLAFPASKWIIIFGYLIAGISIGPWEAYWASAIQREIPQELQGRVFSVDYMGSVGLMPLGMALVGPITKVFGERQFLIASVIFHLVVCALVLLVPGVKDLRSPTPNRNSSQGEQ
ncbi:MAG TPA: MFS transporter [Candidatus Nanopelagicaceae bacterium]|jgi:MFS family permease